MPNFLNGLMILWRRMTGGPCYFETFKAELSLVILCSTRQEGQLTLNLVLLNGCLRPQMMCVSINKWYCWCRGLSALAFIHINPLWPCKSNHPQDGNMFISLVLPPRSQTTERSWLFCSSAASLHVPWCSRNHVQSRALVWSCVSMNCWGWPALRFIFD